MSTSQTIAVQNGVYDLISHSGPVAKLVLLVLFAASVLSWAIIVMKWKVLKDALRENLAFLDLFWHGKSIDEILHKSEKYPRSPVATVFKSGVKEFKKLTSADSKNLGTYGIDNIGRALMRASNTEVAALEKNIGWLATTASAAPFVGLFGTVWGIMNAFQNIGSTGAANLAVVAPGISEALITTATGIGAAIPAVVGYNYFSNQIKRIIVDMDNFSQDFMNIVQRGSSSGTPSGK